MYKLEYPRSLVVYGYDALEWLKNLKGKTALVTTRSLLNSKILSEVLKFVKAEVIQGPRQHVPKQELESLKQKLRDYEVIIGLGGGSIIDGVKLALSERKDSFYVAIPTTLSGAEHTRSGGFTDEYGLKRSGVLGKEIDVIILDPRATLETPKWLLLSTGVRSIDHAVETIYSKDSNPFNEALAIMAYRKLTRCLKSLDSLESRLECQVGSWLASINMRYVKMGMSHMFGYVFGPKYNIPHGITSCISLPTAIKYNYDVAKDKLREIEEEGKEPLYITVEKFLTDIGMKYRLSEFTSLEEALKNAEVFAKLVNNSGNPINIDVEIAKSFIKDVY